MNASFTCTGKEHETLFILFGKSFNEIRLTFHSFYYDKKGAADTAADEAAIDQLVYELYGLSEDEIRLIKDSL